MLTFETNDQISIISYQHDFKRLENDKSFLNVNITDLEPEDVVDGQITRMNLSISHYRETGAWSNANAYNLDVYIIYDMALFNLHSMVFDLGGGKFLIHPSRNETRPGLIHLHTDVLPVLNGHFGVIEFMTTIPKTVAKGRDCKGDLLVEYRYENNLPTLNGTVKTTTGKRIPYRCKINEWKDITLKSVRLPIPEFSMLYDDINGEFFFCLQKKTYATRNADYCYSQKKGSTVWQGIAQVVSLLGIDVADRVLYGIGRNGKSYLRCSHPFNNVQQIEDSHWVTVQSKSEMRKSMTTSDISSLPLYPTGDTTISASGQELWAVTKSGIMMKSGDLWKRVVVL